MSSGSPRTFPGSWPKRRARNECGRGPRAANDHSSKVETSALVRMHAISRPSGEKPKFDLDTADVAGRIGAGALMSTPGGRIALRESRKPQFRAV
ncbi:hypothetical protein GCM10020366_29600 [Saccharopolyspora gregorii]|uniref:Uncharacterized protein n=1 Tax=Saccharopolyspora gregorii TaxID=33914 RepID=A0ABP6RNY1_9PSEU